MERAAQNQQPDPMGEATIAAIMAEVKNTQSLMEERQLKMQLSIQEQERKMMETMAKIESNARKLESDIDKTDSETLKNLRSATGADAIINPNVAKAYNDVAEDMTEEPNRSLESEE